MRYFAIIFFLISSLVFADNRPKIENLSQPEECIYRAKLSAAGSYFKQSNIEKNCENIKILWHNDESKFEIEYVKKWICYGFNLDKDPILTGDTVYKSCLEEKRI